MSETDAVPLIRDFAPVAKSAESSEQLEMAILWGHKSAQTWADLEKEYRVVILAEAGAGKTFEMKSKAKELDQLGRPSFFLRIEDINGDFSLAFEVGSIEKFNQWLDSTNDAWFFLDSVDEARLHSHRDFEKAIKKFGNQIITAIQRSHIFISSRPYAWRFKTDRELIKEFLPYAIQNTEQQDEQNQSANRDDARDKEDVISIYSLLPLNEKHISVYARHRSTPEVDQLLLEIERTNLMTFTGRPFDLENVLRKWRQDKKIGNRLELLEHTINTRLDEINPDRQVLQPLSKESALTGAMQLAAAVTMVGKDGVQIPDSTHEKSGIDASEILPSWNSKDISSLLQRGIFDDVIYGAVRLRHREIRELLAAKWFDRLLKGASSRRAVESLFFKELYGQELISPRLRPILSWLILFDERIQQRALALHPEIAVEGGDLARLPLKVRQALLKDIVSRIVLNTDDYSARDNSAIARIALSDLAEDAKQLIAEHSSHDAAVFFLGRLVWQGGMSNCLDALWPIAVDSLRDVYARIASIRAILTVGTSEKKVSLWGEINDTQTIIPRQVLAEIVRHSGVSDQTVKLLLGSIDRLPPYDRYGATGLSREIHEFIARLPVDACKSASQPITELILGLREFLNRKPFINEECQVSADFIWLINVALHAIERLVEVKAAASFDPAILELLLIVPEVSLWRDTDFHQYQGKIRELVPCWPQLNDELFWKRVAQKRAKGNQHGGEPLTDYWAVENRDHYWAFKEDDLNRVVDFIKFRKLGDDKLIALSLAFRIFTHCGKPADQFDTIQRAIAGDCKLTERFNALLYPTLSPQQAEWEERNEVRKNKRENERMAQEGRRQEWIAKLRANPRLLTDPPNLKPGEFSSDLYWLQHEIGREGEGMKRRLGAEWRVLEDTFGLEVACAYRDAAQSHWRVYKPDIGSEGANTSSTPYSLIFGMTGLEIESKEVSNFPQNLTDAEVLHALRYLAWELNGFPNWLEKMHKAFPVLTFDAVWKELQWELENNQADKRSNYILHDLVYYAAWLHRELAARILQWLKSNRLQDIDLLRYCLRIIKNGAIDPRQLVSIARSKITTDDPDSHLANWYAIWIDIEPETGIPALETWLTMKNVAEASTAAQLFIVALIGGRRGESGEGMIHRKFQVAPHLKSLYVLMYTYIKATDDIERAGKGVYSPALRDDAQDARNHLFNLLAEIPGKPTYVALNELIDQHPDSNARAWMARSAQKRAEEDCDIQPWISKDVNEFANSLERNPTSHRELFEIGALRLNDFKDWLETGNDSLAEVYQKAKDEAAMRIIVANWLNDRARGRYSCAQEHELANGQRPDIFLQHNDISTPVPIELKLLDMNWTGPKLCERLRNQLAGDYLRESDAGCGIMLLVWRRGKPTKKWKIGGIKADLSNLREAMLRYWESISHQFPKVAAIEVVVIDLTARASKSAI